MRKECVENRQGELLFEILVDKSPSQHHNAVVRNDKYYVGIMTQSS